MKWSSLLVFSLSLYLGLHAARIAAAEADGASPGQHSIRPKWLPKLALDLPQPRAAEILAVGSADQLFAAAERLSSGGTILLADGRYKLSRPLVLDRKTNVVVRSASGDPSRVVLTGKGWDSGDERDDILHISRCEGVTIANLSFADCRSYGVKVEAEHGPKDVHIVNCRFRDIGVRAIKGSAAQDSSVRAVRGSVRGCEFENTKVPPANWLFGGDYVAAIDMMALEDWVFSDNIFQNIKGRNGGGRAAIFIWVRSRRVVVERNVIVNCDRGIAFGNPGRSTANIAGEPLVYVADSVIRDNFISGGDDCGIELWYAKNIQVLHNTIWRPERNWARGIRIGTGTSDSELANNLVHGGIQREGGEARLRDNLAARLDGCFEEPGTGNLSLTAAATNAFGQGQRIEAAPRDIRGRLRPERADLGAWQASTVLGVSDASFAVNGRPTFLLGMSYYAGLGAPEDFIRRDLDDLQRYGFNWIRVWATWAGFEHDLSAVDERGGPRPPFLGKLQWLVGECDRRGLIVDVTLHRNQGRRAGGGGLPDLAAHQRAVETIVHALNQHQNWYLDLANERDVRDARYVSSGELRSLRELARRLDPQLLVTASFGGHDLTNADVRDALVTTGFDFLAPHRPRSPESPAQTEAQTRDSLEKARALGRPVPVHYQEPFRRGYQGWEPRAADFLTDLRGGVAGGAAGWCFHNGAQRGAQDNQPRRSFDLRERRLFEQLDREEQQVVEQVKELAIGALGIGNGDLSLATRTNAAARQIPSLKWEERSDWTNVRRDIQPAAVGDGVVDDTAALQAALDRLRDGSVLFLPPGAYRLTAPLVVRNASGGRWVGGLLIGSGRETRLIWDGSEDGTIVRLDGVAYSRFIGFELDGRGRARVGFHYRASRGFQTEVTHRHLAFKGFKDAAILEDHADNEQALAETTFENCLFEDCERAVAFLQFNDYDYTFDRCEFRRCGVAIDCAHGNFYARNCHFEASRVADIRDLSEHCSSIRRCTSMGSNAFVVRRSSVASLTMQDCHVDGWKDPNGAIALSRPPVLLFDCVFTNPPRDQRGIALAPVRVQSEGQRMLISENRVAAETGLTQGAKPTVIRVPAGERGGVVKAAGQRFLQDTARVPGRVFDVRRDFGAKGEGTADDTAAIQDAIDRAAATGGHALAYLPSGRYAVTRTLRIAGGNFSVGGSGWNSQLIWKGPEAGIIMEVRDPQDITLEDLMVGAHDAGTMNNGIDIHQIGSTMPSRMTYDGIYVYGMYQKAPLRKGLRFTGLSANDVVVMPHVQGNLRFIDCGRGTVLANCSYEGSVVIEGTRGERGGLLGFQTRLATIVTHGLYLRDNQSVVMSEFYVEQADNGCWLEGEAEGAPGRATLTGAKFQSFTSTDPARNNALEINNYRGEIFLGPYQFYQEPKRMRIKQQGAAPVDLFVLASSWYGAKPDPQLGASAKLVPVGNEFYGANPPDAAAVDRLFFEETPTQNSVAALSRALDDLRRLGEADLRLNHY